MTHETVSLSNPIEREKEEWKKRQTKQRYLQTLTISSPILLLLLWELLSRTSVIDPRFFPPPSLIIVAFFNMLLHGQLSSQIAISLYRILGGFLLGVIPAILLGLLMGMYAPVRYAFQPLIMALMPIPTLALMPLILIIFGINDFAKMITIAGSVFFPVVINTAAGVSNIEPIYVDVAKNYGARSRDFFFRIALPGALPVMMEGIQMGQAIALLTIVAAEMIGANSGIGYIIWMEYKAFLLKEMYVGLILISFFGYFFSILLRWLTRKLIPWRS
ncbi:ABC transporter permease [Pullulanibacillus sp. KACC 23026]|uniref:ABC transporter permease n=1 Tax=Pullulanibacillus sp. KACC 23026 TaxID=3028315 RepID=UPI0023AE7488|nr:ABC transporter permease [Pullulanibacillus sp. KACC 23026]WEG12286.1 ABC transporter permease [Pullulanibacillus sp. KACC 23026]